MPDNHTYDICIIGGGLAGLSLSIQLSKQGYAVALFEKESYPFHKVCGEYISMESWNFLESLGLPLSTMQLPKITTVEISAPDGTLLKAPLPLGGFGISRYLLDNSLKQIAVSLQVKVFEKTKVEEVSFDGKTFFLKSNIGIFNSKICCGCFGKRSNLDIKWKRGFIVKKSDKLNNYIGVKYHIKTTVAADSIALHNFKDGYCGISKIEADKYCLCYLTTAANLSLHHHSLKELEQKVLMKNKYLKKIFENCERLYESPLTISQISFHQKSQVQDHVLLLGDAAGVITPLCGNGMSMALHSSQIAAGMITHFLNGLINREQLEKEYLRLWNETFSKRLSVGRSIQQLFGKKWVTNCFIRVMKFLPVITRRIIKQTHGQPF